MNKTRGDFCWLKLTLEFFLENAPASKFLTLTTGIGSFTVCLFPSLYHEWIALNLDNVVNHGEVKILVVYYLITCLKLGYKNILKMASVS